MKSERMNILEAERVAQDLMLADPDWDRSFTIETATSMLQCEWIDPYFGAFKIAGMDGFAMTRALPRGTMVNQPIVE